MRECAGACCSDIACIELCAQDPAMFAREAGNDDDVVVIDDDNDHEDDFGSAIVIIDEDVDGAFDQHDAVDRGLEGNASARADEVARESHDCGRSDCDSDDGSGVPLPSCVYVFVCVTSSQ